MDLIEALFSNRNDPQSNLGNCIKAGSNTLSDSSTKCVIEPTQPRHSSSQNLSAKVPGDSGVAMAMVEETTDSLAIVDIVAEASADAACHCF